MTGFKTVLAAVLSLGIFVSAAAASQSCCAMDAKSATNNQAGNAKQAKCVDQTMSSPEAKKGDTVCCPVMGTKFKVTKKSLFATVNGKKVYVCCPMCVEPLKADPGKYLKK
jgi:uncharacterized Zn-binding protein involved in type VI secretion